MTGALRAAERSYPASEVSGRSWKDPMPKGGSQEELPHVRSQGKRPRVPGCNGAGMAKRSYPSPRSGAAARRSYPTSEVSGGGQEELPHVQGALAARAQEGLEELSHIECQEGQR